MRVRIAVLSLFAYVVLALPPHAAAQTLTCDAGNTACQIDLVTRLLAYAREKAAPETPRFGAILREGNAQLDDGNMLRLTLTGLPATARADDGSISMQRGLDEILDEKVQKLRTGEPTGRVVGGRPMGRCGHQDAVGIMPVNWPTGKKICTGVLVSPQTVLTAAHCICDLKLDSDPGQYKVVNGSNFDDARALSAGIKSAHYFGAFDCGGTKQPPHWGRDLALLKLTEPIEAHTDCGPADANIARVASTSVFLDTRIRRGRVVGFGRTDVVRNNGIIIGDKYGAEVPITSKICGEPLSAARFDCLPGMEMVMLDPTRGKDTCGGDSGGPVYVRSQRGGYVVAAITSRAVTGTQCGPGGVYSLITPAVVDWMESHGATIRYD